MADNKKGVWDLQDTRDQITQSKWTYDAPGDPSRLFSLGQNYHGSLGQGDGVEYSSPVQIQGEWDKIYPIANSWAGRFGIAAKAAGTLYMWGDNYGGQLGQNNNAEYFEPVQIPGTNWSHVDGGDQHIMGTRTDGTLWGWGSNQMGSLGINQPEGDGWSSPVQVPGTNWATGADKLSINGRQYSHAIKTDGTLWGWGNNQYGELGTSDSPTEHRSSPTQLGNGTDWSKVSGGGRFCHAIKTNGTLWAWGRNIRGQIGQNQSVNQAQYMASPGQIPGTNWASVSCGEYASIATKTDGTLWVWGNNSTGRLGLNSHVEYSSPVQLGNGTDWSTAINDCRANTTTTARKTDGTLWTWGGNDAGVLGQNEGTPARYSSPVQIPGTWASFAGNDYLKFMLTPSS